MRRLKELEGIAVGSSPSAAAGSVVDLGDANAMAAAAATAAAAVAEAEAAEHAAGLEGLVSPPTARTTSPIIAEGDEEEEEEDDDDDAGKAPAAPELELEPEPEPEPELSLPPPSPVVSSAGALELSLGSMPTPLVRSSSGSSLYGGGGGGGGGITPTGRPRNMRRRGSFFAQSTVSMPSAEPGESVAPEVRLASCCLRLVNSSLIRSNLPPLLLLVAAHPCRWYSS